jgi:hypothetical protein
MCAEAISNPTDIVKQYFAAWETYDIELLQSIFIQSAKYIVRSRNKVYYGIDEIISYWLKNKSRQRNLRVYWKIKEASHISTIVYFKAKFLDVELMKQTQINGEIIFIFDNKNKIKRLTEAYTKSFL